MKYRSTMARSAFIVLSMVMFGCQDESSTPSSSPISRSSDDAIVKSEDPAVTEKPETAATGEKGAEVKRDSESPLQEMTAAELEHTIQSLPDGTRVRVQGVIESVPYVNSKLLTGEPVYSIRLYGYYSEPLNRGLSCEFANSKDLSGLTEEQAVVVEGVVFQGRRPPAFAECNLISKGEVPEHAPVPFPAEGQPPLEKVSAPDGVEISTDQGYLTFEQNAIADDGTLPKEIVKAVGPRLELGKVTVTGSISTAGLKQIAALQGVKRLQLFDVANMERLDFSVLAKHPRLRAILMKGVSGLNSEHLQQIGKLRCLAWLKVEGDFGGLDLSKVDDSGLSGLASLKSLRWLELEPKHKGEPTRVTDEGIAALAALPRLQVLDLWSKSLDGAGFAALKTCPELHTLLLEKSSVTSDGMESLESLPKLAVLNAAGSDLDSSFAATVAKLSLLRQLNLSNTKITDDFFKQWGSPANLTHLMIKSTELTDMGIESLSSSPPPRLSFLDLAYNKEMTKACIKDLKQIKTLEAVTAPRSFDNAAKEELKQAIPDLKVF